jgi:hypothetical protein
MGAGATPAQINARVAVCLKKLGADFRRNGLSARYSRGHLYTRWGTYGYRIIRASNGEVAGLLQFNGRDV